MPIEMTVIAFATLVVKSDHSLPIDDVDSAVLVPVIGRRHGFRHAPNNPLHDRTVGRDIFESGYELCRHVDNNANMAGCCQSRQHNGSTKVPSFAYYSVLAPALYQRAISWRSSSVICVALFMGIWRVTATCW